MFHIITMKSTSVKIQESSPCSRELDPPHTSPQGNSRVFAKMGLWDDREKAIYLSFLRDKQSILEQNDPNQLKKNYKELAHQVRTRKPNQCRHYHEKMLRYYESIPNLIHCLQNYLQPEKKQQQSLQDQYHHQNHGFFDQTSLMNNIDENSMWCERSPSKKLSIKMSIAEADVDCKNQQLPKTDQSIPALPTQGSYPERSRPSLSLNFTETLPDPSGSPFVFPYSPFYMCPQYQAVTNPFDSQTFQGSSTADWLECQSLFLAWRQRCQKLFQSGRDQ